MLDMDPVGLTQRLFAFDTVNPPGQERACLEVLATILDDGGFDVMMLPFSEGRAPTHGSHRVHYGIVLLTHIRMLQCRMILAEVTR